MNPALSKEGLGMIGKEGRGEMPILRLSRR